MYNVTNSSYRGLQINEGTLSQSRQVAYYLPIKDLCAGARILDLGCGTGFMTKRILDWGAASVDGIDTNEDSIKLASQSFLVPEVNFYHSYLEQISEILNLNDYDGVCFVENLQFVFEPSLVLNNLRKQLNPKAWIYIASSNDYATETIGIELPVQPLRKFTKTDFINLTSENLGNPLETGEGHAYLGISTQRDQLDSSENFKKVSTLSQVPRRSSTPSCQAVFFYALWGASSCQDGIVGTDIPAETFNSLNELTILRSNISQFEPNQYRKLAVELQSKTEQLSEANNRLQAIGLLVESMKSEKNDVALELISKITSRNELMNQSKLRSFIKNPPKVALKLYELSPLWWKEILRNTRRNFLR
jgi:2-polyprenyl-3-methyl-5-hydroxy-6-metoxy-1,4-benzoquinol methylase